MTAARERTLIWQGIEETRLEAAHVHLLPDGLTATGTQIGGGAQPYRLDYRLDASGDFITRRLHVEARGPGWWRLIELHHDGRGGWTSSGEANGETSLPAPGLEDPASVQGALDCDLGFSPLTNMMPMRRSGLYRGGEPQDFLMAWVAVPDLTVHASVQRYEFVEERADGSVVRYVDPEIDGGFRDLRLDEDGIVVLYPRLGEMVRPVAE